MPTFDAEELVGSDMTDTSQGKMPVIDGCVILQGPVLVPFEGRISRIGLSRGLVFFLHASTLRGRSFYGLAHAARSKLLLVNELPQLSLVLALPLQP
jgi:hypothetical protein